MKMKLKLRLLTKYSVIIKFIAVTLFLPSVFNFKSNILAQNTDSNTTISVHEQFDNNKNEFPFKIYDCNDENDIDETNRLKFDSRLFYELNMHETILNLYKSCFREGLKSSSFDYEDENPDFSSGNIEEIMFCKKQKILENILYKMVNTFNGMMGWEVMNRIRLICRSETNIKQNTEIKINIFDKLFLLSSYEHELCGNIFRNSMKKKHLNDVLGMNQIKKKQVSSVAKDNNKRNLLFSSKTEPLTNNIIEIPYSLNSNNLIKNFSIFHSKREGLQETIISTTKKINDYFPFSSTQILITLDLDNITERNQIKRGTVLDSLNPLNTTFKELNNCTLILLNIYLLAFKSSCDKKDFDASLSHYDCASNNFSVKSNCKLCQEAYAKWLCSTNIPYYEKGRLAKPCQRYCFNVQNMCPFFRPMDDNFGAQPLFHCRNVVQVTEERPDGYEDDDEHYYDDEINDDDKCYSECSSDTSDDAIHSDLDSVFKENMPPDMISRMQQQFSIYEAWKNLKSPLSYVNLPFMNAFLQNSSMNSNAKYSKSSVQCMFNLNSISSASAPLKSALQESKNMIIFLILFRPMII